MKYAEFPIIDGKKVRHVLPENDESVELSGKIGEGQAKQSISNLRIEAEESR